MSQFDMVIAILKELDRQNPDWLVSQQQFTVITDCCNRIKVEMKKQKSPPGPE